MRAPPEAPPHAPGAEPGPTRASTKRAGVGTFACLTVVVCGLLVIVGLGVWSFVAFRRFEEAARIAEARHVVRAVARAQLDAFQAAGRTCGAAAPVPAHVPRGSDHHPSATAGEDFHRGTPTAGWTCLGFAVAHPIHFQYEVRVGGGYKAPARGGPDAGPDGFEVSAEGDLDGDGRTSLFVQTGRLDRATNTLIVEDHIFVADEGE